MIGRQGMAVPPPKVVAPTYSAISTGGNADGDCRAGPGRPTHAISAAAGSSQPRIVRPTPDSSLPGTTGKSSARSAGWALATTYGIPAQLSMSTSLGMSPKAATRRASMPRRAQQRCSMVALLTPYALISTSPKSPGLGMGRGQRVGDQRAHRPQQVVRRHGLALHQHLDELFGVRDLLGRTAGRWPGRVPSSSAQIRYSGS